MTVAGQTAVTYTYDNANRLTQVQQGSNTVTIGYDDADRRTSVTYPNGNKIEYAYNAASELTSLTYKSGTTTIGDLTYTYDAAGNRIKVGGSFGRTNLPPALTTVSYSANNQQTTFGTNSLTYDLNGNLATITDSGTTQTNTWNARNQLTGISVTGFSASFTYDSFGRRTGKTINATTTNFVYDGLNPVQEKNGSTVTANLITGLGIDEFLTRTDGVGSRALLTDALGSTVALGDNSGTLQTQYTYEPFGYTTQAGQTNTNSYKYTGREDDGTGLYYYRARYYHSRLQRFIAEDPLGLWGGDTNVYSYVRNNPLSQIDPLGLKPGDPFYQEHEAAIDAIDYICQKPLNPDRRWEWGGYIYRGSGGMYFASMPRTDKKSYSVDPGTPLSPDVTAEYHSHNSVTGGDAFSPPNDYRNSNTGEPFPNYLGLPDCTRILKYQPGLGEFRVR